MAHAGHETSQTAWWSVKEMHSRIKQRAADVVARCLINHDYNQSRRRGILRANSHLRSSCRRFQDSYSFRYE